MIVYINELLSNIKLPHLHEASFVRTMSNPESLVAFLEAHPSIFGLCLSPELGGRRWELINLSAGALPNLRYLHCAPFQATQILEHPSSRPLFCLTGIDVRRSATLKDNLDMTAWNDCENDEGGTGDEEEHEELQRHAPWRDGLLSKLRATRSLTHLALERFAGPGDWLELFEVAPQLRWVDVGATDWGKQSPVRIFFRFFPFVKIFILYAERVDRISGKLQGFTNSPHEWHWHPPEWYPV